MCLRLCAVADCVIRSRDIRSKLHAHERDADYVSSTYFVREECSAVQCSAVQYSAVLSNVVWCGEAQSSEV
jgi:hypothetical protein